MPASLSRLEQAVKKAHGAHAAAERAHHDAQRAARTHRAAAEPAATSPDGDDAPELGEPALDEDLDELEADPA